MMGFASGRSLLELESPYEVGSNFTSSSVQQPQDLGKLWSFFHEVVDVTKGPPTIPNSQLEKVTKKTRTGVTQRSAGLWFLLAVTASFLFVKLAASRPLLRRGADQELLISIPENIKGYLVTSLSLHPFACKDCKKAQDLLPTKLELISATKVISSFRLDQVSSMVASCRLDTLRVVNEFQDELSGSEAWFLHSNSRDKLTPAIVELKTSGCHHHILICFERRLSATSLSEASSILHSQPKSTVGTPAYIAPGILLRQEYDGKDLNLSPECRHLISRILVADRATIISIPDIKFHEWFLKNPPRDLMDENRING
ncbi:hypothetical protein F2Q69_00061477 [Brassica cretica]|uniref:Protein kinase domain-containing protein n=1 Tax=Brassica cretica TaxID=69181 RepID=A0A8S9RD39_BRACR|nr:hypothetical protein F2Q69_00061477 [Brassica cretica]